MKICGGLCCIAIGLSVRIELERLDLTCENSCGDVLYDRSLTRMVRVPTEVGPALS
jgi:hypothetical protein